MRRLAKRLWLVILCRKRAESIRYPRYSGDFDLPIRLFMRHNGDLDIRGIAADRHEDTIVINGGNSGCHHGVEINPIPIAGIGCEGSSAIEWDERGDIA